LVSHHHVSENALPYPDSRDQATPRRSFQGWLPCSCLNPVGVAPISLTDVRIATFSLAQKTCLGPDDNQRKGRSMSAWWSSRLGSDHGAEKRRRLHVTLPTRLASTKATPHLRLYPAVWIHLHAVHSTCILPRELLYRFLQLEHPRAKTSRSGQDVPLARQTLSEWEVQTWETHETLVSPPFLLPHSSPLGATISSVPTIVVDVFKAGLKCLDVPLITVPGISESF